MPHAPVARVVGDGFYDFWPIAGSCLQTREPTIAGVSDQPDAQQFG